MPPARSSQNRAQRAHPYEREETDRIFGWPPQPHTPPSPNSNGATIFPLECIRTYNKLRHPSAPTVLVITPSDILPFANLRSGQDGYFFPLAGYLLDALSASATFQVPNTAPTAGLYPSYLRLMPISSSSQRRPGSICSLKPTRPGVGRAVNVFVQVPAALRRMAKYLGMFAFEVSFHDTYRHHDTALRPTQYLQLPPSIQTTLWPIPHPVSAREAFTTLHHSGLSDRFNMSFLTRIPRVHATFIRTDDAMLDQLRKIPWSR